MKVAGTVTIDLAWVTDSADAVSTARAAVWRALSDTPACADVRLVVSGWSWWAPFAAAAVVEMGEDLGAVTVESKDSTAVGCWVRALRQEARALESVMDQ